MRKLALYIGKLLGLCAYYSLQKRRHLALTNINLAFKDNINNNKIIIKKSFIHLGLNLIEFLNFNNINSRNLNNFVTFHGLEHLQQAYAKHNGVLVLTGHIGNWELLAASVSLKGFKTGMVVKSVHQKIINQYLITQREAKNITLFQGRHSIRDILKFLKSGGVIGMVLDQHAHARDSVVVPFFGRPASTLKALAVLSIRTKAPVIPIYSYRDEHYHHHIIIEPEILPHGTELERTQQYTQWLEKAITQHPDQWMWTHNRWKKII